VGRFTKQELNKVYPGFCDRIRASCIVYTQTYQAVDFVNENTANAGRMSPEQLRENFAEAMRARGWRQSHIDAALSVDRAIEVHGLEALRVRAPSADEDRRFLVETRNLLRTDREKYDRDEELQERFAEALERVEGRAQGWEKLAAGERGPAAPGRVQGHAARPGEGR
jgi:hypothetical protein